MDKQHIIDEIKRTALENGGKPLGSNRFYNETGIKKSDWEGRHWARWGDALREAGLEPNLLQGPHDEAHLLGKFIELARELGRFPTSSEIDLKARKSPGFPYASTFFARMGRKHELAARLLSYCNERDGHGDIAPLFENIVVPMDSAGRPQPMAAFGFVYLMKSGRYYKIGRANHVGGREYALAIQLPEKLKKIHEIKTDDPEGIEAYWHNRFRAKRQNGEWFDLNALEVDAFKRRKFM